MMIVQDLPRCDDFFFNDTATTEIYTLSLHDALPILATYIARHVHAPRSSDMRRVPNALWHDKHNALHQHSEQSDLSRDRKSTRLNSSHANISHAVFCLKKKNTPS